MPPGNGTDPLTLPALFESSVGRFATNVLIWEKKDGIYEPLTYSEVRRRVHASAAGLVRTGLQKGDRVALISEGRSEWMVAELGILYAGAINVPLSVKLDEPADLQFRLSHSGCRMAVVSGNHAAKVRNLRPQLPDLELLILLDGEENGTGGEVTFRSIMNQGEESLRLQDGEFERRWRSVDGNDPANICYTSGTVADPKGIVLTHRNYTANIAQSTALYPLPPTFCTLLLLPWDHAFAHTDGIYALSSTGGSFACVQVGKSPIETLRNIPANIREIRPTFLLSVPALAKNFKKGIEAGVRAKGPVASALFSIGLRIGHAYNRDGWNRGEGWRKVLKPLATVLDAVVFKKVRQNFGGRLQYFIGGGALLDIELQRFFYAVGMPMYQGYGLTEAAPVISANTPERHKLGSSGTIVPDLEIKIADERGNALPPGAHGEIVVKGENVMAGYWKNDRATAETVRDGWLYTGDLGYMDGDGFLYVLGRAKSLLIGHDGEKYSPEGIEETIVGNSPYIDQVMLYNNQSPFTVALVVPNKEAVSRWLGRHGHGHTLAQREGQIAVLNLLRSEIDSYRSGGRHGGLFPERWLPSAFAVLDEPFTEQNRFLNSTLKMVRGKIEKHYRDRLDSLFTTDGKIVANPSNMAAIGRLAGI